MIRIYTEIFCWKNVSSFCSAKATHIFSAKNIRILCIESAKTVNEMTLNELVKLTTLWTTGPCKFWNMYNWLFHKKGKFLDSHWFHNICGRFLWSELIFFLLLIKSIWAARSENVPSDMCLVKIQIRLCICAVWSESSLGTFWLAKAAKFLHADNEDSDQTVWMHWLI